jgi:DUF4097 and DUF4098 domain-containing protein YvlB
MTRRAPIQPALLLSLLAALALAPAWAATPINQSRPLDPEGTVEIENLKGRIQVRTWDRAEVRISGSLGKGVEKLVVEGDEGHLVVRVQYPRRSSGWSDRNTEPTDLRLDVPVLADLDIEAVSADIDVVGTAGQSLEASSVSGDVVVAGAPRSADIESVSGDLRVTLNSGDVDVESVSGDITLSGRLDGEVQAESVSGGITIDTKGERLTRLSTATVSGDADVRAALADGANVKAETVSGEVRLALPKSLSARVAGETFSGDLRVPGATVHRPKYGPGASVEHRYGSGSANIRIESFSGDVELELE